MTDVTSPTPTGVRTARGIAIPRRFDCPPEQTWAWITDPDLTATWFGRRSGDPASGEVQVQLSAEEGAPSSTSTILECAPPRRLVVKNGLGWVATLDVEAADDDSADGSGSVLTLSRDMDSADFAAELGPGWEYYLGRLEIARAGGDPDAIAWEPGYVPGQSAHYRALFNEA